MTQIDGNRTPSSNDEALAAVSCTGNIELFDNGRVVGWIAYDNGQQYTGNAYLYLDEHCVGPLGELIYRQDLEQVNIANGMAMFKVDCSRFLATRRRSHNIRIIEHDGESEKELLSGVLESKNHKSLNPNMTLAMESNTAIRDWTIKCPAHSGLRLEQYSAARYSEERTSPYKRLTFTGTSDRLELLTLQCPLNFPDHDFHRDLELGLLIRSDRYTNLTARIRNSHNEILAESHFYSESPWKVHTLRLNNTRTLPSLSAESFTLEIQAYHTGQSHLDIGFVCLAENFSEDFATENTQVLTGDAVDLPVFDDQPTSYIENGDFTKWPNGITFAPLVRDDDFPARWRLRCSPDCRQAISLLPTVYEAPGTDASAVQAFGLRAKTGTFEGSAGIEIPLDLRFLDQNSLTVLLTISSHDANGTSRIRGLRLLGRNHDSEAQLYKVAPGTRIRQDQQLRFDIDQVEMIGIRRGAAHYSAILLVIDFDQHNDVLIKSVDLKPRMQTPFARQQAQRLDHMSFEDPAIISQLEQLRGIDQWSSDSVVKAENINPRYVNDLSEQSTEFAQASINRPYTGFPSVDIIIPIYNALESVIDCVKSVIEKTTVPYTLILVDDSSGTLTADFLDQMDRKHGQVRVVRNDSNLGYTKSVNRGIRESTADVVCILNSDCIVTPHWLEQLVACMSSAPDIGMVGPLSNAASYQSVPRIFDDGGNWNFNPLPCTITPDDVAETVQELSTSAYPKVDVINGFCQLISRKAIEQLGALDEDSFPRGFGEENDYCARARKAGFTLAIADDTYVYHKKSQSFGHNERIRLSQEGSQALKAKHPDIDWGILTKKLEKNPDLAILRSQLIANDLF